jgi:hypothetical protein
MPKPKVGRLIGAVIILIGAILLIAALLTPWYSFQESYGGASITQNSYPDLPGTNGSIQYSCSGLPSPVLGGSCPSQTSYSTQNLNNTGVVAETGFFLLIVGFILGIIATVFGLMSRGNSRRVTPAIWLAIIALILALITPVLFYATLPGALGKDLGTAARHGASSGPWSSFFGSASTTVAPGVSISTTWGPAIGWYLSFVAFVILLIGLIFLFLYRKEPPQPAATPPATAPTS